ncbi:MAG TPA: SPOR domain-containing protein [Bryobacteraceae bacterium]|nr:SPOR domain-containing protein [Bryobacteraceae bacterium]
MNDDIQNAGEATPLDQSWAVREIPADTPGANARLHAWSTLKELRHEALLNVHDCGTRISNGDRVIFCVHEPTDENLAGALADGPLQTDAVVEITTAIRGALDYLHDHGLSCSGIDASEVHASGNRTKLFPERLRSRATEADRAEDLRSLGMLITRAAGAADPGAISDLKLRRMAEAVISEASRTPTPAPASPPSHVSEAPTPVHRRPVMLLGALSLVAIVVAFLIFRGQNREEQPARATAPVVDERPNAEAPKRQPASANVRSAPVSPQAKPAQVPPKTSNEERPRTDAQGSWTVIAATYRNFDAAQKRASRLKTAYKDCACSVYPDKGQGSNYYVIVSSNLSRAAADQLRTRAVRAGLPRDSYVTRLANRAADPR